MKLLIVEDEKALAENIQTYLSSGELVCEMANSFEEAQDKLFAFSYDIILLDFISNKNCVLTRQNIAEHLWGDNVDFLDSFDFVYQHIKNLRKKITEAGGNDYIKTIYGLGYKFNDARYWVSLVYLCFKKINHH